MTTPQELRSKRREIVETLVARFTGGGGYALGPVADALDALEAFDGDTASPDALSRIRELEAENAALKAPLEAVRFARHENMYGDVYYLAKVGKWEMEINRPPTRYLPFYLTLDGTSHSVETHELNDLVTLLLSARIFRQSKEITVSGEGITIPGQNKETSS